MEAITEHAGTTYVILFFKQKAAYEISACLVGSEMCIGDRPGTMGSSGVRRPRHVIAHKERLRPLAMRAVLRTRPVSSL